jgi:ribonuclease P protein component
MLAEKNRLLKKKDFDSVWKKGRSSFDKVLGIKILNAGRQENRFGIMVSLKVSKLAVERNKIKRRIREIIQAELPNFKNFSDIAITVLPAARGLDFKELEKSLLFNFKRLGVNLQNKQHGT